jgi:hypothetical protein
MSDRHRQLLAWKISSGKADREKARVLVAAITRIQNKRAAIEFSARQERNVPSRRLPLNAEEKFSVTHTKALS